MDEPPAAPQHVHSADVTGEQLDAIETLFVHIYRRLPIQLREFLDNSNALIHVNRQTQKFGQLRLTAEIAKCFVTTGSSSWFVGMAPIH
jgi:hypothetical protein